MNNRRKTKIVCTIGPAVSDYESIKKLALAGMNLARLNFSHGTYDEHKTVYENIRRLADNIELPIGIIQDLQGPKIRLGKISEGGRVLKTGEKVLLVSGETASADEIPVTYENFHKDVQKGEMIFLCDGTIKLEVLSKRGINVICRVAQGGMISSRKGVNLPNTKISVPSVTKKDMADLDFGLSLGVDYVAVSFVRTPEDVARVKKHIRDMGKDTPVIAKIEKPEAVKNIDDILLHADAIMVARGDMGVELDLAEVPVIQKEIIKKCNLIGKPVITATQMLESMILNPFPTRAEVSDVANALLDGTSAVMLSGETAVGKYPVEAVSVMNAVLKETEKSIDYQKLDRKEIARRTDTASDAIAHAAVTLAEDINAKAIVPFTISGSTALMISKYRPSTPVLALTPEKNTYRKMSLYWAVHPYLTTESENTDSMIKIAEKDTKKLGYAGKNDSIVVVAGIPIKMTGITNLIKLHKLI